MLGVVPKGAFGYTVDWNAPPLEIDAGRHIEIVDAMINRRVAGIVLAPVDKQALVAVESGENEMGRQAARGAFHVHAAHPLLR